jgi:general secretion pathway protein G
MLKEQLVNKLGLVMNLKHTRSLRTRVPGLTLVELMIVLALIGILAAIAMPVYTNYRERINRSTAIQDIKILQLLISDYAATGGSFPASLAEVGNGGKLDPWGRAYRYVDLSGINGHGKARKNRQLNPINSDFDLFSTGKDGVFKSQLTQKDSLDDIVRAQDGAFVGLAEEFSQ